MVTDPLVARLAAAGCVYAEAEAAVLREAAGDDRELDDLVAGRVAGHPLEHLVGWAAFAGERVRVAPGVFVPRHRTELLVELALVRVAPGDRVVELCCGSGAVALALLRGTGPLEVHAVDVDPVAVACAAANLEGTGAVTRVGDLFAPLPAGLRGRVDVVVASPPYVPTGEVALLPHEARDHEPRRALDGGPSGTDLHARILRAAPGWLRPGGRVLLECSAAQAPAVARWCADHGLTATVHRSEERDATVVEGLADTLGAVNPARRRRPS